MIGLQARAQIWGRPQGRGKAAAARVGAAPAEYGTQPPVPGKNSKAGSTEYPTWREGAEPKVVYETPEPGMRVLRVHLLDGRGRAMVLPSDGIAYRVSKGGVQLPEKKTADGWAELMLPEGFSELTTLEWGATEVDGRYRYQRTIMTESNSADRRERLHARLYNLGYRYTLGVDDERDVAVQTFQRDQGLALEPVGAGGKVPSATEKRLKQIYSVAFEASLSPTASSASGEPVHPEGDSLAYDPPPTLDGDFPGPEGEPPSELA